MINFVQSSIKKLTFKIAINTVWKDLPEHYKVLYKQGFNASKTKEIPFLHNNIDGLVWPSFMTKEQAISCTEFPTRPDDVFLITYPKSGTMWLAEIIRCIAQPKDIGEKNPFGGTVPLFDIADHKQLEAWPSPRYMTSHLAFPFVPHSNRHSVKYIYLARNPKDVAVSLFHFMRSVPILFGFDGTWEEFLQLFMKGNLPRGSYFDHVLEWWSHKDDKNVLFLKYEDLKKDLKGQIKIIAKFLDFNFSDEQAKVIAEKCTFQAMKSNPNLEINKMYKSHKFFKSSSHLRKGIVGDWKNYFSDEQLREFNTLNQSRMQGSGLQFESQSIASNL